MALAQPSPLERPLASDPIEVPTPEPTAPTPVAPTAPTATPSVSSSVAQPTPTFEPMFGAAVAAPATRPVAATPTDLTATAQGNNTVLKWSVSSPRDENSFKVERTQGKGWVQLARITNAGNLRTYTDSTRDVNLYANYRVRSFVADTGVNSPYSNEASVAAQNKVAGVQMWDGKAWSSVPSPLSVLKGTNVKFRATRVGGGSFPSGLPTWKVTDTVTGAQRSVGSGTEVTIGFDTASAKLANKKVVTATTSTEAAAGVIVGEVGLDRVDFANNTPILQDNGNGDYSHMEWSSGQTVQTASPLLYSGGQTLKAQSFFWVLPVGFDASAVKAQGKATGTASKGTASFLFPERSLSTGDGAFYPSTSATTPLASSSNIFEPLRVSWQIKVNGSWQEVGVSVNKLYRTWKPNSGAPLYLTVVDIACRNARGISGESTIANAIWGVFKTRHVNSANNFPLKYWKDANDGGGLAGAFACQDIPQMIDPSPLDAALKGVGTCVAWAKLMKAALRTQGITSCDIFQITPTSASSAYLFLVKDWSFNASGSTPPSFAPYSHFMSVDQPVSQGHKPTPPTSGGAYSEIYDKQGASGQSNPNPPGYFGNHFIVGYGGKYYDPSYGNGPFSSQNLWENGSIDGFATLKALPSPFPGGKAVNWWVAKRNGTSQELNFTGGQ